MPSPSAPPPLPGDLAGPYRLIDSVGLGGMAAVYRAEGPAGIVAVKILHQSAITIDEIKRFRREYLTLARLDHPNIVRVLDAGEVNGYPWIAMQFMSGPDLGGLIEKWKTNPPPDRFEQVERLFRSICLALAYVHERGIVHRDLKPGNILLGEDGDPRLSDFGVVKDTESFHTSLTLAGRLVGTVAFMAPEQITGDTLDARADLYSLGAILYTLLTGRRPIIADSFTGYLARQLTENPRPPSEIDARVPRRLERVCMKLLQKDPARRYPSATQVLAALDSEDKRQLLPIHGREDLLGAVLERVRQLRQRRAGGVMALIGPVGTGRSRLLAEVAERARELGANTAFAKGGPNLLASLLAALPDTEVPEQSEATAMFRIRSEGQPWVMIVDDIDDAPQKMLDECGRLVRHIVAVEGGALLLVVSARSKDGAARALIAGSSTGLSAEELVVGPLDRDAVRALLRDRGMQGAVAAVLGRRLHEELGGLPGAVLEQVDALVKAGWLVPVERGGLRAVLAVDAMRTDPLPLPDRVRDAEGRFLAALAPSERLCLDALAVLDAPSSLVVLTPLTALDDAEVRSALVSLTQAGQVEVAEEALQEVYSFPSRRRRQVIYESIPALRRGELHAKAAATLQRLYKRRAGAIAEVAAHHLLLGGDPAGAYPLLIQAAGRALRRADSTAAWNLCHRAHDARATAETRLAATEAVRWRRQLFQVSGDAQRALDRLEAAAESYTAALTAARAEGERSAVGRAEVGLGLVHLVAARSSEALASLERGLSALERGDVLWPEAALALGLLKYQAADRPGAERLWREVGELGRDTRNRTAELDGAWGLALIARAEGDRIRALNLLEGINDSARDRGLAEALVRVCRQRAELAAEDADWAGVVRASDDIERAADQVRAHYGPMVGGSVRVMALSGMGETETALRTAREVLSLCVAGRARSLGLWLPPVRALARANQLDDPPDPLIAAPGMPDPPADSEALRRSLLAFMLVKREPKRAVVEARAALDRPPSQVAGAAARVELDCAWVLNRAGEGAEAGRALRRAVLRLGDRGHRGLALEALLLLEEIPAMPFIRERVERLIR